MQLLKQSHLKAKSQEECLSAKSKHPPQTHLSATNSSHAFSVTDSSIHEASQTTKDRVSYAKLLDKIVELEDSSESEWEPPILEERYNCSAKLW